MPVISTARVRRARARMAASGHDLLIGAPGQNGGEVVGVHVGCSEP